MPGHYVKDGGVWKEITTSAPSAKVAGAWVPVKEIHAKNAGVWTKVWPTALPPTPTNLRFQFYRWSSGRYEVQPLWDPVQSDLADGYHLEVTRTGGNASQASAAIVDTVRDNFWWDFYLGTTGGCVLTYRVRSYKGATVGDWSAPLTATTPADAGWCQVTIMALTGVFWGALAIRLWQDTNPQNAGYVLYRQQMPWEDWNVVATGAITGVETDINTSYVAGHYRGDAAGNVNTQNAWSNDVTWSFHLTNTWGKPNDQAGNPYPGNWGPAANYAVWKPAPWWDNHIRLNAVSQNVYRQQPTNSLGWVGGVMRCGGVGGDMLGVYFYNKGNLIEWGFRNRINAGQNIEWGLGRRNDGGNVTANFNTIGLSVAHGYGGDPRFVYGVLAPKAWQRNQGENMVLERSWSLAFVNPAQGHGSLGVVSSNSTAGYAEFGNVAEIMGGWVNGQIVLNCPWG